MWYYFDVVYAIWFSCQWFLVLCALNLCTDLRLVFTLDYVSGFSFSGLVGCVGFPYCACVECSR